MIRKYHNHKPQTTPSATNPPIKALRQSRHRVWGLTHRRAIKEETIAVNQKAKQNAIWNGISSVADIGPKMFAGSVYNVNELGYRCSILAWERSV